MPIVVCIYVPAFGHLRSVRGLQRFPEPGFCYVEIANLQRVGSSKVLVELEKWIDRCGILLS
jgi:hypothetical protein